MASLSLQLKSNPFKPHHHHQTLFSFSHFFSTSSNNNNNGNDENAPQKFSSYFSDIKSRLNQPQQPNSPNPNFNPRKIAGFDEIRKNLSEFRLRSLPETGSPPNLGSQKQVSLTEVYNRNVGSPNPNPVRGGGNLSFDSIRQSLRGLGAKQADSGRNVGDRLSSKSIIRDINFDKNMFRNNNNNNNVVGGAMENLPEGVFGKEIKEEKEKENDESRFELVRTYHYEELGKELKKFRPDLSKLGGQKGKKDVKEGEEGWFSLSELRERIGKLKDEEERLTNARLGGAHMGEMRKTLKSYRLAEREREQMTAFQRFDILGSTSLTVGPPKEHLIEKYFHPDNMSAAEKLKLELKKVRDEFKMSESDCGSARVQIAQLTTEIRHLSSVLLKKDKHSRKGLHAKVQQRKKLLKYLRRTDWDSYCFVLSKLGLRDNPDYKN